MAKKTAEEKFAEQTAANEKRKAAGVQQRTLEEVWAEHLLTEHGVSAISQSAADFHVRYYRQCPFFPPPPLA